MAGRIRDADVALVRQRSPIVDVVSATVSLRPAGGGRLTGLCPFHDEKSPSFSVNPSLGLYHCFGCSASGDVITFLRETEALSFTEAVERLASHAGITLTYEQGGAAGGRSGGQRQRLVEAHRAAAEFYREQLAGAEAAPGREFLTARGFDPASWETFGVGYAPAGWDALLKHLTGRGFSAEELLAGGLVSAGRRGPIDRFRGRLVWPIRERAGDVIGFGARRLRADDTGPKYLNTPETPLYRKSSVLYGLDLARKEIALRHQAVVVEGYTDVMACHLAGVPTAVATCGTAFGPEHITVLRLMLLDQDEFRGEVIYTFDGDQAGRNAALKAFTDDQRFVAQTFVAVGPDGMDPCELRLARGDAAVRDLVAAREPLFTFAIRSLLTRYDLETAEGRVQALDRAAPIVAAIKDRALRPEYARRLAGWLGLDVALVTERVGAQRPATPAPRHAGAAASPPAAGPAAVPAAAPVSADPAAAQIEREVLKLVLQYPALAGAEFDAVAPDSFVVADYRRLWEAVRAAGGSAEGSVGPLAGDPGGWVRAVSEAAGETPLRALVGELALERLFVAGEPDARYAEMVLARLGELSVSRELTELKGRLERMDPAQTQDYQVVFGELLGLEARKRALRQRALGGGA